jgi:acetylglutamate kinase
MEELISKAATLLEALPYIQRFRSQIFVVKYGGSFMDSDDPEVRHRVARDVVFLEAVGINPVVVHGGGKAITRALELAGVKARFVQGYRVTDGATVEIVEEVLSHETPTPTATATPRPSPTPRPRPTPPPRPTPRES